MRALLGTELGGSSFLFSGEKSKIEPSSDVDCESRVIFRQLFDNTSSTYSYLLASRTGGEALIIDPVLERVDRYIQPLRELNLKLVKAVDTHLHADHITGLGALRERTHCITVMGSRAASTSSRCVSRTETASTSMV